MGFFTSIGILAVIFGLFYLLLSNEGRKQHEADFYEKFLDLGNESSRFRDFCYDNSHYSREQALRKYYSISENYDRAQKLLDEKNKLMKEAEDRLKKEYIMKRIYAYQYEDFIFSVFSPLAIYEGQDWSLFAASLPYFYIVQKLAEYKKINIEDAGALFEDFVNNELVWGHESYKYKKKDVNAPQIRKKDEKIDIGMTLSKYANVISDSDMNITNWINKNGQSMTREQLEKEIEEYSSSI